MEYSLSSSLVGGSGSLNPDKLSLDLPFATTKSLTAAKGPTPTFVRASTGTYFGSDGYLKSAANNVARFDHETSYAGSTILVQCIDCVDVYNNVFSAAERIPLSGIDGNGYPYFLSSLFSVSYDSGNSLWLLSYNGGDFEAYSTAGLSDEYIAYGAIGGVATVTAELACKGLLIEESSANLLSQSESLNITWTATGLLSISSNVLSSPSALTNADKITEDSNNSAHGISQALTTTAIAYTLSFFAKKGERNWIRAFFAGLPDTWFDVGNGVTGTVGAGSTAKIENVGNGWFRCSVTATAAGGSTTIGLRLASANNVLAYLGDGVSGAYIWGAQFEAKAFPTSYIPTTTGTAPRSADLCSITGTAFTSFYNQPAGTIVAGVYSSSKPISGVGNWIVHTGTSAGVRTFDMYNADPTTLLGTGDIAITTSLSFPSKMALAQTNLDFQGCFNGTLGGTSTVLSMGVSANMHFGNWNTQTRFLNGCLSSIKYYKKRLPNAKLQSLTAP